MTQFANDDIGTKDLVSKRDIILESDSDMDGAGDIVFRTGGVERARINAAGVGTGWPNVLGGSRSLSHYDPRTQWLGNTIQRMLASADQSLGIAWLTDSTGNDKASGGNTGDWPYELGLLIAAAYPTYTVRWRVWNDTSQDYDAPVTIQTGTAGARYLRIPGTNFSYTLPNSLVAVGPTDLDVSVLASLDDWTPAAQMALAAHSNGAGSRGWWLQVETNGKLSLVFSNDGTALLTKTSTVAPTVADGATLWVRATLDVDNGASGYDVKFYTSADGASWTQLGTTVTTATATTLFNPAVPYYIGSRDGGNTTLLTGNIYEVRIRSGIPSGAAPGLANPGPTILPVYPDQWEPVSSTSPTGATGAPVLDLLAGAMPGQGLSYLSNSTRLPMLLPDYSIKAVFMATSINESSNNTDSAWLATWASWVTAVKARAYEAVPIVTIENPVFLGATITALLLRAITMRRDKLLAWAQQQPYATLDGWQAFLDTGNAQHYINATDFTHPRLDIQAGDTYSGAQIWARDAYTALFSGV